MYYEGHFCNFKNLKRYLGSKKQSSKYFLTSQHISSSYPAITHFLEGGSKPLPNPQKSTSSGHYYNKKITF